MRSFKDNSNIIKSFIVNGAVNFYLPYYLDGEDFIKQLHVSKEDFRQAISEVRTDIEDFEDGLIEEDEVLTSIVKNWVLTGLMELEQEEPSSNELRLYQYIADIIMGNLVPMFEMTNQITECEEIEEETIEEAENNVYVAIGKIFYNISKQAEIEKEKGIN